MEGTEETNYRTLKDWSLDNRGSPFRRSRRQTAERRLSTPFGTGVKCL